MEIDKDWCKRAAEREGDCEVGAGFETLPAPADEVLIDYTNWRGERTTRRIRPLKLVFENDEWHPNTQWLLEAVDIEKGQERTFAMANIHAWWPRSHLKSGT